MPAIRLYGLIGKDPFGNGTSAAEFIAQLPDDGSPVEVRINSEGGSVVEGFAIANALHSYKGETIAVVEGQASSAASYVAASCKTIKMFEASYMIVHGPWDRNGGDAATLRKKADDLDSMAGMMRALYRRRGIADKQINEWLAGGDHVLTPEDAAKVGLCDEIIKEPAQITAQARAVIMAKVTKPLQRAKRTSMDEYAKMDRKALRAAYKSEADEDKKAAIAKVLAEKDDTTTGEGMQDRVNAEADKDPAVKALVEQLAGTQAALKAMEERQAKAEAERDLAAFVAECAGIYSAEEAKAQYAKLGGSVARLFVAEIRKVGAGGSMFKGGTPVGRAPLASAAGDEEMTEFRGMHYRDISLAKRARELTQAMAKTDPHMTHGQRAEAALKAALAEKGRV